MKNSHLNTDGPIPIPDTDFHTYRELIPAQNNIFDRLFYTWVDETYSDGVRRLCLRDMLQQPASTQRGYYVTGCTFGQLLRIGNQDRPKELYWQLHNRPALLEEFVQELQYLLEKGAYPYDTASNGLKTRGIPRHIKDKHTLLELVFRLVDDKTGMELLPYYNICPTSGYTTEQFLMLLTAWMDERNPQWLHDTLHKAIFNTLNRELDSLHISPKICSEFNLEECLADEDVALNATLDFIAHHAYKPETKNLEPIFQVFDLFQANLPKNCCFLPYLTLVPFLYQLKDEQRAFYYLKGHIMSEYTNKIELMPEREAINFCFWASGLTHSLHPSEDAMFAAIDKLRFFAITSHMKDYR